jgi:hypothetical protein
LKSNEYNIDDVAIIDDEAGFAFNNGTNKGEGRKTGPGTLAEGETLVLAYVRNNEKFCLEVSESFDRDDGDDGRDGDDNGTFGGGDGDEHHHGR